MKINFGRLAYCFILVFLAMIAGRYYNSFGMLNWYNEIEKPMMTPPDMVFPIVWSILYTLMAIAFYQGFMVASTDKKRQKLNGYFLGLLFLHILWSYAFFYMGYIGMALIVVIIIDIVSYMIMMMFWATSTASALLFFPYFVWILFATYLNASFVNLNGFIIFLE